MGKEGTAICTHCGGSLNYDVLDSEWRCRNCGRRAWPEQDGGPGQPPGGPVLAPDPALARSDPERWLEEVRGPGKKRCPRCNSAEVSNRHNRAHAPYRCRPCSRTFSARIGTVLEKSKLYTRTWLMAFRLYFSHPEAGPDRWPSLMAITPEAAATAHGLISNAIRTGKDELVNRITALVNRGQIDWEELTKHMESTRSDNRGDERDEAAGGTEPGQAAGIAGVLEVPETGDPDGSLEVERQSETAKEPASAGLDEVPEVKGQPEAAKEPDAAGLDEVPEVKGQPEAAKEPEPAGLDEVPEVKGQPEVAKEPEPAGLDEVPEVKGQPEVAKAPEPTGVDAIPDPGHTAEARDPGEAPEAPEGPDTVRLDETPEKPEAAGLDGTLDEVQKGAIALRFLEDLGQELQQNMDELSRRLESVQGATTEIRRSLAGQPDRP